MLARTPRRRSRAATGGGIAGGSGGRTDIVPRWPGAQLAPVLGQPFVIDDRAGGIRSVDRFVQWVRANPGKASFASFGTGGSSRRRARRGRSSSARAPGSRSGCRRPRGAGGSCRWA
jgi:hypothetical protein